MHLAGIAGRLELGSCVLLGRGEERQSGRQKPSVLADALEAVVAAVYLDGGYEAAREVVRALFQGHLGLQAGDIITQDYKTSLQEYAQKWLKVSPEYKLVGETGPAHNRFFEVEVWVAGTSLGRGQGQSKKQAAQEAAHQALRALEQNIDINL
jgi:ribonuclease-3